MNKRDIFGIAYLVIMILYSLYINQKIAEKRKKINDRDDLNENEKTKEIKKTGCLYIFIGFILFFILMILRSSVLS